MGAPIDPEACSRAEDKKTQKSRAHSGVSYKLFELAKPGYQSSANCQQCVTYGAQFPITFLGILPPQDTPG
jgi:hypothetical protein